MNRKIALFTGLMALAIAPFVAFCADKEESNKASVEFKMETTAIDRSNKDKLSSYADTIEKVTPAVVSVRTAQMVRMMPRGGMTAEDLFRRIHGLPPRGQENSQPIEKRQELGLGSGTIIHPDGYILTNRHVISEPSGGMAEEISVELTDGREFTAKVIGSDPQTDVAIIKIDGKNLPVAKIADSDNLRVGDVVFAIGNPLGVGMTVTSGIVSALGRKVGILGPQGMESFIQTDASINRGNSGGPLVDADGRVVGMNTVIVSPTGTNIGIGFAVPSNLAVDIISSLANEGEVVRGFLGVQGQDVTKQLAEALGLPTPKGAILSIVAEGSPADKGGLKVEDVVMSIDGKTVESWSAFQYLAKRLKPGEKAKVVVYRDGKELNLTVEVGVQSTLFDGKVDLRMLSDDLRKTYGIPKQIDGVIITDIANTSELYGSIPKGTVILSVNGQAVKTAEDVNRLMKKDRQNTLRVYVNGRVLFLTIKNP
jgi:serine protease Do/serine protease DegQ